MPARKTTKPRWWTVILLYPDYLTNDFGADIFVDWAIAPTAQDAVPMRANDPVQQLNEMIAKHFKRQIPLPVPM